MRDSMEGGNTVHGEGEGNGDKISNGHRIAKETGKKAPPGGGER